MSALAHEMCRGAFFLGGWGEKEVGKSEESEISEPSEESGMAGIRGIRGIRDGGASVESGGVVNLCNLID